MFKIFIMCIDQQLITKIEQIVQTQDKFTISNILSELYTSEGGQQKYTNIIAIDIIYYLILNIQKIFLQTNNIEYINLFLFFIEELSNIIRYNIFIINRNNIQFDNAFQFFSKQIKEKYPTKYDEYNNKMNNFYNQINPNSKKNNIQEDINLSNNTQEDIDLSNNNNNNKHKFLKFDLLITIITLIVFIPIIYY